MVNPSDSSATASEGSDNSVKVDNVLAHRSGVKDTDPDSSELAREAVERREATLAAQKAAQLRPNDVDAVLSLGLCLLEEYQNEEAERVLRRAVSLNPGRPDLHTRYSISLLRLGREEEAVLGLRHAIKLDPKPIQNYLLLGRLMLAQRKLSFASDLARRALIIEPRSAEAFGLLGKALVELGQGEEGEAKLRAAISLDPNFAFAYGALGARLQSRGEWGEARTYLERSVSLCPHQGLAYWNLVQGRTISQEDLPLLERIREIIEAGLVTPKELSYLHYALGKASDDLGEYELAMSHYDNANRLSFEVKLGRKPFDPAIREEATTRAMNVFSAEFLQRSTGLGDPSLKPILIVGQIRSGTTLVEQIVSSHPDVSPGGEMNFWLLNGPKAFKQGLRELDPQMAASLIAEYKAMLDQTGPETRRVTDKMPQNFQMLGLVHSLFPNASIIHVTREPVDNCLSIYFTPYDLPAQFAHVPENIVFAYKQYQRLAEHWRSVLPAGRVLEVAYEDLVQNQEAVTRRIIEYCGLDWSEACLMPELNDRIVDTPSVWQVRQPMYNASVDKWKHYEPWLGAFKELL